MTQGFPPGGFFRIDVGPWIFTLPPWPRARTSKTFPCVENPTLLCQLSPAETALEVFSTSVFIGRGPIANNSHPPRVAAFVDELPEVFGSRERLILGYGHF